MVLTSRFQRMGDLAAGTMVVVEESRFGSKVPTGRARGGRRSSCRLLPLRVSAGSEMARALSDYVRHRMRGSAGTAARRSPATWPGRSRAAYACPSASHVRRVLCAFYHRLFLGE